jgi:hypothetical protein
LQVDCGLQNAHWVEGKAVQGRSRITAHFHWDVAE